MVLRDMAQEYRANTALMELRMKQLQVAQRRARQKEVRFRLKQRIGCLRTLINESRKTAYVLEHYYERGGTPHDDEQAI
ncbi:MAG: hypothetical protein Q4D31_03485 [Eubacteriales bacterium]|nr:hypothetical protein [Eubacteriales bacterium]